MAKELATKSMLSLDEGFDADSDNTLDSPRTPTHSPSHTKHKFTFKFPPGKGSPKGERRNYSHEVASIPDIQVLHILIYSQDC